MYKRQIYSHGGEDLWSVKIQEIRNFQCGCDNKKIPTHLADRLIAIYEKYKNQKAGEKKTDERRRRQHPEEDVMLL